MPIPALLKDYAAELGFAESETLARIFELLWPTEDEIRLVAALPGAIPDVAAKTGLPEKQVADTLNRLLLEGSISVDFANMRRFRRVPALIFLRDFSVHNPATTQELFELWDRIVRKESSSMVKLFREKGVPSATRVLPIERTVESANQVLDVDSARKIFSEASLITAAPCVCRTVAKKNGRGQGCPAPKEAVCMQTNFFAAGVLAMKVGEKLSKEEALRRIGLAEDAGLVHMSRNNVAKDTFMCNCCSCCCTGFELFQTYGLTEVFAPSRFRIKADTDMCSACGECVDRCQFKALSIEDTVVVDESRCFGCGNCAIACSEGALNLEEIRPVEHIRVVKKPGLQ